MEIKNLWGETVFSDAAVSLSELMQTAVRVRADLSRADLRGATLRGADLRRATLCGADLSGATLRGADLRGADLRRADLRGADLRGADLSGADLRGAVGLPSRPVVKDLDRAILKALKMGGTLDMKDWHTCQTTHCRAGWAILLAGEGGTALETRYGPACAGALIYAASRPTQRVPDFYASAEETMQELQSRTENEK